ncbi:PD-(D/E)XK nuclease family protein [Myxococcota bacterium]|nr:PD-(D/E)XK nuclease family protein [Myxococcota bacterium]
MPYDEDRPRRVDAVRRLGDLSHQRRSRRTAVIGRIAAHSRAFFAEHADGVIADARRWLRVGAVPSLRLAAGEPRREVPINRIMGWLLDPGESHGAGAAFLCAVARHIGFDDLVGDLSEGAPVRTYVQRVPGAVFAGRMPDLLIDTPRSVLLLENKVDARETRPAQYADYRAALEEWAGTRSARAVLAAPGGRDVPEGWSLLTHAEIARLLRHAASRDEDPIPLWARAVALQTAEALDPMISIGDVRTMARVLRRADRGPVPVIDIVRLRASLVRIGEPRWPRCEEE